MPYRRSTKSARVAASTLAIWALGACGGGGTPPEQPASITGTVLNASTDEPLSGATVSVGSVQATTDASGRFHLAEVSTGPAVAIRSQRPGFVETSEDIVVEQGENTHDIRMTPQSVYLDNGLAVYIPTDLASIRGVILGLGGFDTRGYATGAPDSPDPAVNASQLQVRQGFLALAAKHGLAIAGSVARTDGQSWDTQIFAALGAIAAASDHPELAQAPLFTWGISAGAPESYGLALRSPQRVIGFSLLIGDTPSFVPALPGIPGYVHLAELDVVVDNAGLTTFFTTNRARGALWAYAVEPGASHTPPSGPAQSLVMSWMDTVLGLRLPETVTPGAPLSLRDIEEAAGWLGDRASFAIAPYADYPGDKRAASWFPSEASARAWQSFVTPDAESGLAGAVDSRK